MKVDRMGVYVLASHLIITLAMIGAYVFFTWIGKPTGSIENMLLIAIGFWFASMSNNAIRPPASNTTVTHANEVKVEAEKTVTGKDEIK